jgi:hypothetical protein
MSIDSVSEFMLGLRLNWPSLRLAVTSFLKRGYGGESSILDLSDRQGAKLMPISAGIIGHVGRSLRRSAATYQQAIHNVHVGARTGLPIL